MYKRGFPKTYGKLLKDLYIAREKADYGEYVPSLPQDLDKLVERVHRFAKAVSKRLPRISTERVLQLLVSENESIRDFSFDIYCPKSYFHHTRFTAWCPKGRVTDAWLAKLLNSIVRTLRNIGVEDSSHYVLGLNSRVNQYEDCHLVMLDLDNVSSVPIHRLKGEAGFLFRTESGFHFVGTKVYRWDEWSRRMKKYSKFASKQHCELSLRRGYATLRVTSSPRKAFTPVYMGSTEA